MTYSFFIEMAWKSALIAGTALLLARALASRAAADKAATLRVAVAILVLLPLIPLLFPWTVEVPVAAAAAAAADPQPIPADLLAAAARLPVDTMAAPAPTPAGSWDDPTMLIVILYIGGLVAAGARLAAGLLTLRRWTAQARPLACRRWTEAFEQARDEAGAPLRVRLLASDEAPSPLSWGLLRPVILLDRDSVERPEDADAILAHEMAHIVRRDWLTLILSRLATILFWFNPLVRLVEREVAQHCEEAADCAALRMVQPELYAQTLIDCAQQLDVRLVPANSIGPVRSGLARRVAAILDSRRRDARSGSFWGKVAIAACAAFAAPLAAVEFAPAAAETPEAAPAAPAAVTAPRAPAIATAAADGVVVKPVVRIAAVDAAAAVAEAVPASESSVAAQYVPQAPAAPLAPPAVAAPPLPPAPPPLPAHWGERLSRQVQRSVAAALAQASAETAQERAEAIAEARAEAEAARREAITEAAEARREAQEQVREAMRDGRIQRAAAAEGLLGGAAGMEQGAREMRAEAERLRNPEYRRHQIARAAAEGRVMTDQQLIDAIAKMRRGADKMEAGAARMRAGAEKMRRDLGRL
jgi:beta-lactamase regulating signal transducer with metallopeptidase domain